MPSQAIDTGARSSAPREAVWEVIANARRWPEWAPCDRAALEQEGAEEPGGVGAVRALTRRGVTTREVVTVFEPPERLCYELRSGLPLRGYKACVTLADADGGGTQIRWRSEFDPKLPGTGRALRRFLSAVLTDVAERAAREAERQAASTPAGR